MTYEELLAKIEQFRNVPFDPLLDALHAVVELCNKWETKGSYCLPIEDVIKVIEGKISDSPTK